MLKEKLGEIGLSEKEAGIYLAALELGETSIERISKKSKIRRTTVYDVIDSLKEKGLIGSILKNKKRFYFATDPRELEDKLEQKKNTLRSILPQLLSVTNLIDKKPRIKFYEEVEGIKEIYMDTLKYPDQPLWAWVTDEVFDVLDKEFTDYYVAKRVESKIFAYVITPNTPILKNKYQPYDLKSLRKTKIDPAPTFSVEVEINLYGNDKIGIMAFGEKIGLIIESKKLYNTLKNIFDVHWKNLN